MEDGPKVMLGMTAVVLLAVGGRVAWQYKVHRDEANAAATTSASVAVDPDDNVYLKKQHPDSLADQRALIGQTVWISAGGQMDYYRDTGKHVDYAHPVGLLLSAEPLQIKEVFEEVAPKTGRAVFRIPAGRRQVLLGFTMPKSADPKALYAMVVGNYDNGYNMYNDDLFYYDDPHQLFNYWPAEVWAHIDRHEPALGMSQRQVMMAVGQVQDPHGGTFANRSITFDNAGKPVTIEFEHDKAVKISRD